MSGRVIPFRGREPDDPDRVEPGKEIEKRAAAQPVEADGPLEGELVTEPQPRIAIARRIATPVVRIAKDDRTHRVARGLGRHAVAVLQGVASWWHRGLDASTMRVYRRQVRAAEQAGDKVALAEWMDRQEAALVSRSERREALPKIVRGYVTTAVIVFVVVVVFTLVAGVVAQLAGGRFGSVVMGVIDTVFTIAQVVAWVWTPFLIAAPFLLVFAAWREGRKHATPPVWLQTPAQRRADLDHVTPAIVVKAVRDLGISELRKKIDAMEDGGAGMLSTIVLAGRGVEVTVQFPSGISTGDIKKRRQRLAENLGRHEHELFLTVPQQARALQLWIADPGALAEPIEPSPLVTNPPGRVSMARDTAPWGKNLRDRVVGVNLWQKHLLITGLSNMGKTAALRALALWLAHDPTVEFRCADLKGIGDWNPLRPFCTEYVKGPTDTHVVNATEMLEDGVDELESRLQGFDSDKYPDGVPEGLLGFHPIVFIVDEAQVAYTCPAVDEQKVPYGGKANNSRFLAAVRKIQNQGRAVNVLLWQGTQNPTDQNFPKLARDGAHIRASLKLADDKQARMAMGDEAFGAGAAPHELRPENRGVVIVTGPGVPIPQGQSSETVFTHYISGSDGFAVAEHALEARRWATTVEVGETAEVRDLLADVLAALRGEDEYAPQVARRLRDMSDAYSGLSGEALAGQLRQQQGVPVRLKDGSPMVRLAEVRAAIARRENDPDRG
jgi:S-DNA-T family DNA segregation ATPase FtsK/SpoIIIE